MPIAPTLSRSIKKHLTAINPHLTARWNRSFNKWDIWFDNKLTRPYIILRTPVIAHHIYDELRRAMWWSRNIKYNMTNMQAKWKYAKEKKLRDEEDDFNELGKEIAPVLRTMHDAGTSSHGRSKFKFPGFGEGK